MNFIGLNYIDKRHCLHVLLNMIDLKKISKIIDLPFDLQKSYNLWTVIDVHFDINFFWPEQNFSMLLMFDVCTTVCFPLKMMWTAFKVCLRDTPNSTDT